MTISNLLNRFQIKTNKSAFETKLVWLIESEIAVIFSKENLTCITVTVEIISHFKANWNYILKWQKKFYLQKPAVSEIIISHLQTESTVLIFTNFCKSISCHTFTLLLSNTKISSSSFIFCKIFEICIEIHTFVTAVFITFHCEMNHEAFLFKLHLKISKKYTEKLKISGRVLSTRCKTLTGAIAPVAPVLTEGLS